MRNLGNRGEISKIEFDQIRPKNAKPAKAHGLQKIHKTFTNFRRFRPIMDTTGSSLYLVGKYLAQLLYPLINNEFTLGDSFETANRIHDIPSILFVNGYKYVSFDVESLFTNLVIKNQSTLYLHVYIMTTLSTQISKNVHSKNSF